MRARVCVCSSTPRLEDPLRGRVSHCHKVHGRRSGRQYGAFGQPCDSLSEFLMGQVCGVLVLLLVLFRANISSLSLLLLSPTLVLIAQNRGLTFTQKRDLRFRLYIVITIAPVGSSDQVSTNRESRNHNLPRPLTRSITKPTRFVGTNGRGVTHGLTRVELLHETIGLRLGHLGARVHECQHHR